MSNWIEWTLLGRGRMRGNDPFLDMPVWYWRQRIKHFPKFFERELKGRRRRERGREKGRGKEKDEGGKVWCGREQRGGIKQQRGWEPGNEGWGHGLLIWISNVFLTWHAVEVRFPSLGSELLAIITCLTLLPQGQSMHHRVAENTLTKLSTNWLVS